MADVRVTIDEKIVREKRDREPLSLEPGTHVVRFEVGSRRVEKSVILHPGEKMRMVSATFAELPNPHSRARLSPRPHPHGESPSAFVSKSATVAAGSLTAVAALGFTGFGVLRWWGMRDYNSLYGTCRPNCDMGKVDTMQSKLIGSYVSLGVGAAAGAVVIGLLAARLGARSSSTALQVVPTVRATGAAAHLIARF